MEDVFGRVVGGLRVGLLRGHVLDFGLRVALFLFLREQIEVGLRALQRVLGLFHFAGRGGALFLQTLERVEIALRRVAVGARLDDLRLQGENFFLRSAMRDVLHAGLRALEFSLRVRGLAADAGVVELKQELPLPDVVAFLHEQAAHGGVGGRVGFEILRGLDFAVSRDDAADGSAFDRGGADGNDLVAHGGERRQQHDGKNGAHRDHEPAVTHVKAPIFLCAQCHDKGFASNNLPPAPVSGQSNPTWSNDSFRCTKPAPG